MRKIPLLVTLAAIACACVAQAHESWAWKLAEYATPNYNLITPDDNEAPSLARGLSQVESLLSTLVPDLGPSNGLPATIFVMPYHRWNKYLEASELDAGLLPQRFSTSLLLAGWRNGGGLRTMAYYEYTRLFMRARYRARLPFWYEVGLAYLAYGASLAPDGATIGLDPFDSARSFSSGSFPSFRTDIYTRRSAIRLPLAEVLRIESSSPAYADPEFEEQFDYQSWKLVQRAFVTDLDLGQRVHKYLERVAAFDAPEDAARQAFDKSLADFDADMAEYEKNSRTHLREARFTAVPPPTLSKLQDVDSRKALLMVARALLESGRKPARITRILEETERAGADFADLLALRMRVAIREQDDGVLEALIKEAETRIRQPRVARELALALYERVHEEIPGTGTDFPGRQAMRERAFQLLTPIVIKRPDDVEAAWSHAMLAAALKRDLNVAASEIAHARELMPRSPDLALAAALVKGARGQGESPVEDLMGVVRFTANSELRLWAARHIDVMRHAASEPPGS